MQPVRKTTLSNGVRIISQEQPHAFSAALGLWWAFGSRDENYQRRGLSHFLEHMAFKGAAARSALDIARQIDRLGGHANAFTSKEHTCYYGRALDLEDLAGLLTDLALDPMLDADEIERERGVILQEIASVEETPDELAFVLLQEDFWPDHALGRSILGAEESIRGFSRQDMRLYLEEFQAGPRLVAAAAGKLNHDELVDILAPRLGGLPAAGAPGRRSRPTPQAGRRIAPYQCEQEHILLAMPALPAGHEQRMALAILNLILGGNMSSRLFQQVREARGLAYSVYSFLQNQEDCGMLGVYLAVPPERCREALQVVMDELALLASQPVSAQELRDAKKGLEGGVLLAAENMESRAGRLARDEFTFGREMLLAEIIDGINAVDEARLAGLARRLLQPERMRLLALGPVEEEQWKFA